MYCLRWERDHGPEVSAETLLLPTFLQKHQKLVPWFTAGNNLPSELGQQPQEGGSEMRLRLRRAKATVSAASWRQPQACPVPLALEETISALTSSITTVCSSYTRAISFSDFLVVVVRNLAVNLAAFC